MLASDSIPGMLVEHRDRIRSPGIRRIGVFGSFARGKEHEESDIDVLVDRDTVRSALAPYILQSVRYAPGIEALPPGYPRNYRKDRAIYGGYGV